MTWGTSRLSLILTPSGTALTDTTYDPVGRAATVSNPYYQGSIHASDPTYGITQTQYDALGRTIRVIKPDGSSISVLYNASAADGLGASVICTTSLDETGKPRQVCSDALGRMVKVIEPNSNAMATGFIGWVTVNGVEQSASSQPATSGQTTVSISGTEQSAQINCVRNHCTTVWDTGTATITVAGFSAKTVSYGQGDTPATVAWKLSCAFHNDTTSAADASCPASAGTGTQVVLTARTTGVVTNYSFTTSSATDDPTDFAGPSFTASPASGAFTGGQNAATTADSGTISITINGAVYSTAFGAGDTRNIRSKPRHPGQWRGAGN